MPSVPPAPPIFSTTIGCPSMRDMCSPTRRATTSVGPPAAKGTMMTIGFVGYSAVAGPISNADMNKLYMTPRHTDGIAFPHRAALRSDDDEYKALVQA